MPLTQCLSSVGVGKPSPLNTCLTVSLDPRLRRRHFHAREGCSPNNRQLTQGAIHCRQSLHKLSPAYQLAQVISVLSIPMDLSSWRFTAPGTVSKNAGQPQPELLHISPPVYALFEA